MNVTSLVRTLSALCAAGALAVTGVSILPTASATQTAAGATAETVADLSDSGENQQRWISEPDSRIVLNPSHSQTNDAKPKANDSLDTVFYANQDKVQENNVVNNSLTTASSMAASSTAPYDEGDPAPALSDVFTKDSVSSWSSTDNGARITSGPSGGTVSTAAGNSWGGVGRDVTIDVAKTPILLVEVASTQGKWSVKVNSGGEDIRLQDDTNATGIFTYDLAGKIQTGSRKVTVKLFTADNGDTVFKTLSIHARPGFEDNFTSDSLKSWSTKVQSNNGATIAPASNGMGATVTSTSSSDFGAVARPVTVNLTSNPIMTVAVDSLSKGSMWALKLSGDNGNGDFATIQLDTSASGIFSYNIADLTGKSGSQTFWVKLFSTKSPTPTSATFTRLSFHSNDNSVLRSPNSAVNTWNPQSLVWSGAFADSGSYTATDVFVSKSTIDRLVDPSSLKSGSPTLVGTIATFTSWDASTRVLTTTVSGKYARSIAFPGDAVVTFYRTAAEASTGAAGSTIPNSDDTTWVAALPGDQRSTIAFGYEYGTDATAQSQSAEDSLSGASVKAADDAISARTTEWNDYLGKVPAVNDYSLNLADARGVSANDIKAMYYRAFVDLRQTVVPAQPESGISHYQVATGKAATYNSGSSRNKASASWDSLLGMQYLAYIEPDIAWDSYLGMMDDVGADGNLNGESLPSRKAQTAWILYSVTGNRKNLETVYPTLKKNLIWSSEHLAWNFASHYYGPSSVPASDERDAEYVVSLATDLSSAINIATTLGNEQDAEKYRDMQNELSKEFNQWFFMDGKAVQYYWTSKQDATYQERAGIAQYVTGGLHMPGVNASEINAIMQRFDEEYNPNAQFAGLASDALKAPDAQFVAYGLLEQGQTEKARVFLEEVLRDVTVTHAFGEVYQAGDPTISRGESPTTFGMAQIIDNLWILNGYRSDAGTPTFVRLANVSGTSSKARSLGTSAPLSPGISGLAYSGKRFNVSTDNSGITLSGDATTIAGACTRYTAAIGVSTPMAFTCGAIDLSSTAIHVGDVLQVKGSKYLADSTVALRSDGTALKEATADKNGNVTFKITFTSHEVGDHELTLSGGDITAQAKLTVLAAAPNGGPSTNEPGGSAGTAGNNGSKTTSKLPMTGAAIATVALVLASLLVIGLAVYSIYRKGIRR